MSLKVDVVSKEIIKPSVPTPHDLRILNLSLIDQHVSPYHGSVILYYYATNDEKDIPDRLKKSLSSLLAQFYPFAGRIHENVSILCNDAGANFYETQVDNLLSEFLSNPDPDELHKLVPKNNFDSAEALLNIHANIFKCGGVAVGVSLSHKVADASSFCLFLNNWAALTKGDDEVVPPKLDLTHLFPPRDIRSRAPPIGRPKQKVVTKRFVFDASSLDALKARCSSDKYVERPSRVEAVSALIWRCAMNVERMKTGSERSASVANFAMNLRGRLVPPLSNNNMGNLSIVTMATLPTENHPELDYLVGRLREATRKIDVDFVKNLQADDGFMDFVESTKPMYGQWMNGELDLYNFTSWCRFPFYESDFGWGKPIWISPLGAPDKNLIMLLDTKCGTGVEAYVALYEEDMATFESDPEFICFTSTTLKSV